jgi:hypothetical protein
MNKTFVTLISIFILLAACAPTEAEIQSTVQAAIAQTQAAYTPTPTLTFTPSFTNTPIFTSTPKPTNTPKPSPTPKQGTIQDPLRSTEDRLFTITKLGETSVFELHILQVIRGDEAYRIIKSANMFNDKPPEGMEYVLIQLQAISNSGTLKLSGYDFVLVSKGQLFDGFASLVCCLKDEGYQEFEANIVLPGVTAEGWIARPVFIDDPAPMLAIGVGYDNDISDAIFILLTP